MRDSTKLYLAATAAAIFHIATWLSTGRSLGLILTVGVMIWCTAWIVKAIEDLRR